MESQQPNVPSIVFLEAKRKTRTWIHVIQNIGPITGKRFDIELILESFKSWIESLRKWLRKEGIQSEEYSLSTESIQ